MKIYDDNYNELQGDWSELKYVEYKYLALAISGIVFGYGMAMVHML